MVDSRLGTYQAVQRAGHLGQLHKSLDELTVHESLRQWSPVLDGRDSGLQDLDRLLVHVLGNDGVHPERPGGHEMRHLNRYE
jgi:hypothetical protein